MDDLTLRIILQILLAAFLGGLIGLERKQSHKSAGMRTYSLIAMGSALFTILSYEGLRDFALPGLDPSRIASHIVVGIGFIGAGLIFLQANKVRGLTTAAGVWVSAAIGMAAGFQMYAVAIAATAIVITILFALWALERNILGIEYEEDE